MAKKILLEHDEVVQIVNALEDTSISLEIMIKFKEMLDRDNVNYYKPKKEIIAQEAYTIDDEYYTNPIDYFFRVKKVTAVKDSTKTCVSAYKGAYYIKLKKDSVFAQHWEAKIYGYRTHISELPRPEGRSFYGGGECHLNN